MQYFKIGGMEAVVKELVMNSSEHITPIVCALRKVGFVSEDLREAGFQVTLIGLFPSGWDRIRTIHEIGKVINYYYIDILHCHDIGAWFYGVIAGKIYRVRRIFHTRHGFLEHQSKTTILLSRLLSHFTDRIVAVSPEVRHNMLQKEHLNRKKIKVIYNGINLDRFQISITRKEAKGRLMIDDKTFVLGTVTRFYPVKNVEMQLELVHRLKDKIPNFRLLIVGPKTDHGGRRIENMIKNRKLEKYITLLGFRQDVPQILKAIDVFIITSFSEGTSMSILEAMASKCAIVASAVGGTPHIIEHMRTGLLFDVDSLRELYDAVLSLYLKKDLRKQISKQAFIAVQQFSVQSMAQHYERLYHTL